MIENLKNRFSKSDGYIAIESVISMSVFLMIFIAMIGLFLVTYPRVVLLQEMHSITRLAEIQGGLTEENVAFFEQRIEGLGFVDGEGQVELTAVTESGLNAAEIDSPSTVNPFYIERDSLDAIYVKLTVPINTSVLNSALDFFGVSNTLDETVYEEIVYSERY